MTDEQVCIWKLVREIVVNPKYPVSREYGNVDACFFRTDCGIDINRQRGTREMHKNWLNGTKCSHCHRPVQMVIDDNVVTEMQTCGNR